MCIVDGGIKMKPRMRKLVRYECATKGCGRLWALNPDMLVIREDGPIFDGYERNGRKKWRREGYCGCGTAFAYPSITVKELKGE